MVAIPCQGQTSSSASCATILLHPSFLQHHSVAFRCMWIVWAFILLHTFSLIKFCFLFLLLVFMFGWAEALLKIARMTLTIKRDGNWSSFQLANSAPPLSVTDSAIAPSARMTSDAVLRMHHSGCNQCMWSDRTTKHFQEAKLQIAFIVRFPITVLVREFDFLSTVLAQDHFYSDFLSLHVTI